jgi:hypothetical protein
MRLPGSAGHHQRTATSPCAGSAQSSGVSTSQSAQFNDFCDYLLTTQKSILSSAAQMDGSGKDFRQDRWERDQGNPNAGEAPCVSNRRLHACSTAMQPCKPCVLRRAQHTSPPLHTHARGRAHDLHTRTPSCTHAHTRAQPRTPRLRHHRGARRRRPAREGRRERVCHSRDAHGAARGGDVFTRARGHRPEGGGLSLGGSAALSLSLSLSLSA